MKSEKEIAENLLAAGCGEAKIENILASIQKGTVVGGVPAKIIREIGVEHREG